MVVTDDYAQGTVLKQVKSCLETTGRCDLNKVGESFKLPGSFLLDLTKSLVGEKYKLEGEVLVSQELESLKVQTFEKAIEAICLPMTLESVNEQLSVTSSADKEKVLTILR